ncbi:MAG: hypothetical protein KF901_15945 [Myxococcales bacterium]|nr:hypothetical protein [Myxococcales bacterium]
MVAPRRAGLGGRALGLPRPACGFGACAGDRRQLRRVTRVRIRFIELIGLIGLIGLVGRVGLIGHVVLFVVVARRLGGARPSGAGCA